MKMFKRHNFTSNGDLVYFAYVVDMSFKIALLFQPPISGKMHDLTEGYN